MLTVLEQYETAFFCRLTVFQPIELSITMRGSAWLDHVQLHVLRHDVLDILSSWTASFAAGGIGHTRNVNTVT